MLPPAGKGEPGARGLPGLRGRRGDGGKLFIKYRFFNELFLKIFHLQK